jgi:hypothetical protein
VGSLGSTACRLFHNSQAAGARRAGGGYSVLVDLEDRRRVASVLTQKFDEYDQALTRMNPPLGLPLLCRHELAGAENCCANLDVTRNPFAA